MRPFGHIDYKFLIRTSTLILGTCISHTHTHVQHCTGYSNHSHVQMLNNILRSRTRDLLRRHRISKHITTQITSGHDIGNRPVHILNVSRLQFLTCLISRYNGINVYTPRSHTPNVTTYRGRRLLRRLLRILTFNLRKHSEFYRRIQIIFTPTVRRICMTLGRHSKHTRLITHVISGTRLLRFNLLRLTR